ncbi:MAG TPA: DUF3047 domain-containing protein [Thermodesulfobacteriota bacterium]
MRRRAAVLIVLALAPGLVAAAPGEKPLGTFENSTPGKPPEGWKARGGDIDDVYVVRRDGDEKFLSAEAEGQSVQIGREERFDVKRYPILSWRWRVHEVPRGGDERKKETGDSAAGVYVVFGGWPIPNAIKYVWSATLPPGTRLESPFASQTKIVVLRSGQPNPDRWVEEQVNVLEDYRTFFGEDPPEAKGIGILSDSDNTGTRAVADYDAIVARSADAASTSPAAASGAGAR